MKQLFRIAPALLILLLVLCSPVFAQRPVRTLRSPGGQTAITVGLNPKGEPFYKVRYRGKTAVDWSRLGLMTKEFDLKDGFKLVSDNTSTHDETWDPVWGEVAHIRDHYNELAYNLEDEAGRKMTIRFRAYDGNLTPRTEPIAVNSTTSGEQEDPSLGWLPDRSVVVAYSDTSATAPDRNDGAVRARVIYPLAAP